MTEDDGKQPSMSIESTPDDGQAGRREEDPVTIISIYKSN